MPIDLLDPTDLERFTTIRALDFDDENFADNFDDDVYRRKRIVQTKDELRAGQNGTSSSCGVLCGNPLRCCEGDAD